MESQGEVSLAEAVAEAMRNYDQDGYVNYYE